MPNFDHLKFLFLSKNIYCAISSVFLVSFLSKLSERSFIVLYLLKKEISPKKLYIFSLVSSLLLNIITIMIGLLIKYFMFPIINLLICIVIFSFCSFSSIFRFCHLKKINSSKFQHYSDDFEKELDREINRIIDDEDDSHSDISLPSIKGNENEEIELEDFDVKKNELEKKGKNEKNEIFLNACKYLFFSDLGDLSQISIIPFVLFFDNFYHIFIGNYIGNIIVNLLSILYGGVIKKSKIDTWLQLIISIIFICISGYLIYIFSMILGEGNKKDKK